MSGHLDPRYIVEYKKGSFSLKDFRTLLEEF